MNKASFFKALGPLLRHRSVLPLLSAVHAAQGDLFQLRLPGFRPWMVAGPALSRYLLVTGRHHFQWRNPRDPVTRLLRHGFLVQDGDAHVYWRQLIEPFLQRPQATAHVDRIWQHTVRLTAGWRDGGTYDMLPEMRRLALLVLLDTVFGVDATVPVDGTTDATAADDLAGVWPHLLQVLDYIAPGLWLLWPEMPRPGYATAIAAVDRYLLQLVAERRRQGGSGADLLSHLVRQPGLSDDLIRDQFLTLLIAGHDTSTALLAWTFYLLGRHPQTLARCRQEVDELLGGQSPPAGPWPALPYLDAVIKESLRLYPPIHAGNRCTRNDLALEGNEIAAGSRVMLSIYLVHRHPDYWEAPDQFRPERFLHDDGGRQAPFSYLPFGGGPRNCIGAAFAQIEARTILACLLQKFELRLLPGRVWPHMGATLEPRPGVRMEVRRKGTVSSEQ
jgi:cytochrome P450